MSDYPDRRSKAVVTFVDGEVKEYRIDAGSGIAPYLCDQASSTGFLTLLDRDARKSYSIPVGQIREWELVELKMGET